MMVFTPRDKPLSLKRHPKKRVPECISWDRARDIMEGKCFGPRDVLENIHVRFSRRELEMALQVPFFERTLIQHSGTHALFFGVSHDAHGAPLTISKMHQIFCHGGPQPWYKKEELALKVLKTGWYLVALSVIEESRKEPFSEQEKLLKPNEYRGSAVLYSYLIFMMRKVHSFQIFGNDFAWCSDITSSGYHAFAGGSDIGEPQIFQGCADDTRHSHIGLVPVVKPDVILGGD